jgi:type II secretory ATPase GspE/PulE/Tfp pilus assembly ATPase PilB-like protein
VDVFRTLNQQAEQYTWWSNRGQAWAKNVGWRLDYQIATPGLAVLARKEKIHLEPRFSDHAPLLVDYDFGAARNGATGNASAAARPSSQELVSNLNSMAPDSDAVATDVVTESDNTLVRLINSIIDEAIAHRASDIHIETEPAPGNVRVRLRIDGDLVPYLELPARFRYAMVARHQDHGRPWTSPSTANRRTARSTSRALAGRGGTAHGHRAHQRAGSRTWCCACWPVPSRCRWKTSA